MMDDKALLQRDSVFSVGKVVSVDGRRVRIAVNKLKNSSHLLYRGNIVRNVAVGSYIKIAKGFDELIAVVDGERVAEDRAPSKEYRRASDSLCRTLEVSLIGYLEKRAFVRGVRELPLLGNECFILTEVEFTAIHNFVSEQDTPLRIGSLAMEPSQPVTIGTNAIFASHVGIFGNTGSGKSYSLTKLYHELFNKFGSELGFRRKSQFVLIDFNGEYVNRKSISEYKRSTSVVTSDTFKSEYRLSTRMDTGDRLPLPLTAVHDPTFWSILLDATEKTQAPFISRTLRSDYWENLLPDGSLLMRAIERLFISATHNTDPSVDKRLPLNFLETILTCLGDSASSSFLQLVDEVSINLDFRSGKSNSFHWKATGMYADSANPGWDAAMTAKFSAVEQSFDSVTDIDLVRFKLVMQFYKDIISGYANREHIGPLIKRLEERVIGIKRLITVSSEFVASRPLTVVSLRDVNLDMRKVIPMILCRHLYQSKKKEEESDGRYLNFIIDEAHNILSLDSVRESDAWRDYRLETFEEIVKEGRKFGVFLTISSQRPHDISPTIISQLHNYFLHRLVNDMDIRAVEKAVAYLDRVSFESLPILPTGVCILAGVSTQVPVMVKISEMDEEFTPNSRTMSVTDAWLRSVQAEQDPE